MTCSAHQMQSKLTYAFEFYSSVGCELKTPLQVPGFLESRPSSTGKEREFEFDRVRALDLYL
jgi:hypothetical protein